MNTRLTFRFSQGRYNGSLGMRIKEHSRIIWEKSSDEDTFECHVEIKWPTVIEIDIFGKGPNDTLVTSDGKIEQDKYIKLESIMVDYIPLHILSLLNIAELDTGKDKIKTNYWGFNGTVKIVFDEQNSFIWHLKQLRQIKQHNDRTNAITEHQDNAGQGTIY